jgi:hypothetical protein
MTAAPAVNTSGSQTATVTTEHTLATVTSAKVLQLAVDVANLAGGTTPDIVELRIYGKARSGDTEREMFKQVLVGAQAQTLVVSPPVPSPHHWKATLKQTQGTGRAFPWAAYEV